MKPPQIDIGKQPNEHLSVTHLSLPLPSNTPFGNMLLKYAKILRRLDYANQKLQWVYKDWGQIDPNNFDPFHDISTHLLWIEEICYFLRVTTDELISLSYLIYFYRSNGDYPRNIEIHSIGKLLEDFDHEQSKHYDFKQKFARNLSWLKILNKITNAYKHSFLNFDTNLIGKNEPCVPILNLRFNNLANKEEFIFLPLMQIIDGFNDFYKNRIVYLRET